jgi:hypothetical protein
MHTDASRAEPETFHAFTIGSDAFIATNGFAEVLWILARKVLPFRSVPTCRIHRGRFDTTNRSDSLNTPPRPLPIASSIDNKREVHQFFCQQSSELQLAESIRLREILIGQSCIDLDDGQNECENPDFPILCVNALL